jgi:hypothetical protein
MFVLDRVAKKSAMNSLLCTRLGPPEPLVLTDARRRASLLERLVNLMVEIRATTAAGVDVDIARAVDEAFASIAREYRR